ncbi:hypothetical protein [Rhodoferax ferrireducens]|uniref:hypothetical protein n=1 Tax=Rhodoferax ferrireducens TaxID=192843 RepID=UPI000E0D47C8|nr:hypothetical protein [Rhodoferax ferrireducens]
MTNVTLGASVLLLSLAAFAANTSPPDRSHLSSLTETELKTIYLHCEQLASTTLLDFNSAAHCSTVSEELLERSFGGNFKQLLQWWHSTRSGCRQNADCANERDHQTTPNGP